MDEHDCTVLSSCGRYQLASLRLLARPEAVCRSRQGGRAVLSCRGRNGRGGKYPLAKMFCSTRSIPTAGGGYGRPRWPKVWSVVWLPLSLLSAGKNDKSARKRRKKDKKKRKLPDSPNVSTNGPSGSLVRLTVSLRSPCRLLGRGGTIEQTQWCDLRANPAPRRAGWPAAVAPAVVAPR